MAKGLLVVALAFAALVVAAPAATASSAGFCSYGVCAGVAARNLGGAAVVQACVNLVVGCQTQFVPHNLPLPATGDVICQVVAVPQSVGGQSIPVPTGATVVSVCV